MVSKIPELVPWGNTPFCITTTTNPGWFGVIRSTELVPYPHANLNIEKYTILKQKLLVFKKAHSLNNRVLMFI